MSKQPSASWPRGSKGSGFSKRPGLGVLALIVLVVLVLIRLNSQTEPEPQLNDPHADLPTVEFPQSVDTKAPEAIPEGTYAVRRVVDGDTLLMVDGTRLRLIGINCPESVKPDSPVEPFGPEASQFTKDFIGRNKVRLQFDKEREDKYGRKLAYVFVGDEMLNEELLRAGLARYEHYFRYSETMKRRFRKARDEARDAKRGIWSVEAN